MGPQIVLSFLTIFLHHVGSVNHALFQETSREPTAGRGTHRLERQGARCVNAYHTSQPYHLSHPNLRKCALGCEDQLNSRWHSSRRSAGSRNVTHGEADSFDFACRAQCAIKKRMQFPSYQQWSPANVELFQAVTKITILVLLKLIIKYYIRGYLKAHIASKAFFELIELSSKALTIAIAKCAIKWALYPALRTASKTFLIASLKSIVKPFTSPLTKSPKGVSLDLSASCVRFVLNLSFKVLIKTIALEMLVVVFENEATQMPLHQLMARVTLILVVKMSAKRICKLGKQKTFPREKENDDLGDISAAPVDKMLMFAIKKLVTKLVKIPLIKMLL